jgi:pimeloyl-ACP methyl ester carboxylesterase
MRVDAPLASPVALPVVGDALRYTVTALTARATLKGMVKGMFAPCDVPADFFTVLSREMMLRPSQLKANAEDAAYMMPAAASLAARYSELRLPVAILAGAADEVADPEAHSVRLHDDLAESVLVVLPEIGHMVHYAAADAIVALLADTAANEAYDAAEIRALEHA